MKITMEFDTDKIQQIPAAQLDDVLEMLDELSVSIEIMDDEGTVEALTKLKQQMEGNFVSSV